MDVIIQEGDMGYSINDKTIGQNGKIMKLELHLIPYIKPNLKSKSLKLLELYIYIYSHRGRQDFLSKIRKSIIPKGEI